MSFSSRSSRGNHYREGHHGSNHYQKKGLLGNLFNMLGSGSGSGRSGRNQYTSNNNQPMQNQPMQNQNSMSCNKCNSKIPAGSKFCLQCGEKVNDVLHCMSCGEKMPSNARFCLKCGKKINE
jgi:membrane protease subunit (stomatin/prohibitin family)